MSGLPKKWSSRGADPFRQAQSVARIKVTTPEAFLSLREASSMEDIQLILMRLPPEVVVADVDGERVLHYRRSCSKSN